MTRVVGIDPGTLSIDLCGTVDGQLYLDQSWPTADALSDPAGLVELLTTPDPPDLIVGPSGYGLPLRRAAEATETDLRLAFLAPPDETGGIGGLRGLARALAGSGLPVVYIPGVIHLDTVPAHRKLNRVDLGTADKLCAAALGIRDQCERRQRNPEQASFILIELGGAFTAGVAVERGQVVDGIGGTSGGVMSLLESAPALRSVAVEAYIEGATKAARQLRCSAPSADEVLLSGRNADDAELRNGVEAGLADLGPVRLLTGFATIAKQGAQGAALIADGLAGGTQRPLLDRLRIREARGTVLDHLVFVSPAVARRRLGIEASD